MSIGSATFSAHDRRAVQGGAARSRARRTRGERYPFSVRALICTTSAVIAWGGLAGLAWGVISLVRAASGQL